MLIVSHVIPSKPGMFLKLQEPFQTRHHLLVGIHTRFS